MTAKRIVLIEENLIDSRLVRMALRSKGYLLLSATSNEDGLKIAVDQSPDLIIKALPYPEMGGLEIIRRLKETPETASIPIIALPSYATEEDKERIIQAGCDACIEKPISTRELPKTVERILLGSSKAPGL